MTVGLGIGSPQNLAASSTPEMCADLCKCHAHTALSWRNVDQIVIPFTRNEHNRRPAVQNLNARIEANFVIKNWWPLLRQWFFFQVRWIIKRSLRLRSYEKHECYLLLKIDLDQLLKVHRKCVCVLMKHIAVYRKMISSEIWNFLRSPFYASQPIAKLNFKLSIPVEN